MDVIGKLMGEAGSAAGLVDRVSLHVAQQQQATGGADPARGKVLHEPTGGPLLVGVADQRARDVEGALCPGHGDFQLAIDAVHRHMLGRALDPELCDVRVQRENEGEFFCTFVPLKC